MVGEDTEDLCEVRINFAGVLRFGKDVGKLGVTGDPVKLVNTVLLALTDEVEAAFDVSGFASESSILGNLDGGFIVNHQDGRNRRKALGRFTPLFGAKVEHVIEKHSDVGCCHGGRACSHILSFRSGHCNRSRHGGIGFNESTIVEDHVSNSGAASIWAILPAGVGEYREIGVWDAIVKADFIDGV